MVGLSYPLQGSSVIVVCSEVHVMPVVYAIYVYYDNRSFIVRWGRSWFFIPEAAELQAPRLPQTILAAAKLHGLLGWVNQSQPFPDAMQAVSPCSAKESNSCKYEKATIKTDDIVIEQSRSSEDRIRFRQHLHRQKTE